MSTKIRSGSIFLFLLVSSVICRAQLPSCSGNGIIHYVAGNLYNYNPALPISATNPSLNTIAMPPNHGSALAVSQNLNGGTISPTFYTVVNGTYAFYNGTGWTNTGHISNSINIGGGGAYLYGLISPTSVSRYDGTGNAVTVPLIGGGFAPGIADVQGDAAGGVYVLRTGGTPQSMDYYNSMGLFVQGWTLINAPVVGSGGGFGIIGNKVYYNNSSGLMEGTIAGNSITFTLVQAGGLSPGPADFGVCPATLINNVSYDSVYYCAGGSGLSLSASGAGPYNWTVESGPATITGNGSTVVANTTATSVISRNVAGTTGTVSKVTKIIVPTATVNAGNDHTVVTCRGFYQDTLHATLTNTSTGIPYAIAWSPAASIIANGNTLNPVVNAGTTTTFTVTATTPAAYGSCSFSDNVLVTAQSITPSAAFDFEIKYGCIGDSVLFTIAAPPPGATFDWAFGNGLFSTSSAPKTIPYPVQGQYDVRLRVSNNGCTDSVVKTIDTRHSLLAAFTADRDSLCANSLLTLSNASTASTINGISPQYTWDFADGTSSTLENPTHTYTVPGVYRIRLIVKDFVPCTDTAYKIIVVDSLPATSFLASDTIICEGQQIIFTSKNSASGLQKMTWDFGDGSVVDTTGLVVNHAYDTSGSFTITVTGNYRHCITPSISKTIRVKPFARVNAGEDQYLCPGGAAIRLIARATPASAVLRWNTGGQADAIMVNDTGSYQVTANLEGCLSGDAVSVLNDCYLSIPNSFTPNSDNVNDYFFPSGLRSRSVVNVKMIIFNRWGQQVYNAGQMDDYGWDGRLKGQPQPQGVYVYLIDVVYTDGRRERYKGNVTLLH